MKIPGGKLKDLQKHWYKILEDSGFKDIEKIVNGELVLKQTAAHNFWDIDPVDMALDEEYFRLISHRVNDDNTTYKNEADRMILRMHADGSKIKTIVEALQNTGMPRERKSVRIIIRRYEMEWNIKQYSPKELNKKTS